MSARFIILVGLTVTLFSEKMLISTKCIHMYMVSCPTQSKNLERTLLKMRTVPFGKSFTWLLSISGRLLSVKNPSFFNQEPLNLLISEIFHFFVISKLKNPIDEKLSVLCIIKHFENIQILRLHLNFHNIFFHI